MNKNLLEQITDYAIDLRIGDIPEDALELAKLLVFDCIGTGLGGWQRDLGRKVARYARRMLPGSEATLLGSGDPVSAEGAAFANGVMNKILGMDDSHRQAGHIASQVVPAVLAIAEADECSGEDMLVAIVAAYDFAVRVGALVRPWQRSRGLDVKGTVGAISTALAVARCVKADRRTMMNCIALAADLASGTEQYVYEGGPCDTKDLISGFAAKNAIFALRLAEAGFDGPRGALDGEYGFFRAFGDGDAPDAFTGLGSDFAILGTAFKPHGGCRHTHQAVDAAQALLSQGPLNLDAIDKIELGTYAYATKPIFRVDPNPPSRDVAGLSIRVSTAVTLKCGSARSEDFAHWDAPDVRRLRNLIEVAVDDEIESAYPQRNGCRLRIDLADGERREIYLPNMKGEPEFRLSHDELRGKFAMLTRELFDDSIVDMIWQRCMQLESMTDVAALMRLCAANALALA